MKRRAESAFGIHFDFHARPGMTVGTHFHPEIVAELLDAVRPDYVQCDTKGHAGLSSYPTKVGTQADAIAHDVLRMWRDLTAERDIALYVHHSGILEKNAVALHPEWAVVSAEGVRSPDFVSVFSPYAAELLIPQLTELIEEYRVDGAWIDGDNWAAQVDYSSWATEAYFAQTGKQPPRPGEDGYDDYRRFCRAGFERYVKTYVDAIHEKYPDFQITSNWMYSSHDPGDMRVQVDFLSGDMECSDSVRSARYEGRVLACRGIPWDIMSWGHDGIPRSWETDNRSTKELGQYCQEAAQIMAMGGGYEFFNIMYGFGGTVQKWAIPTWAAVAKFCRAREKVCFKAKFIPQVAVVYPDQLPSAGQTGLFGHTPCADSVIGWINLLQECGFSTEIKVEEQLADLQDYGWVIVPDTDTLRAESVAALIRYAENGGKLLLDGQAPTFFADHIGISSKKREKRLYALDDGVRWAMVESAYTEYALNGAEPVLWGHAGNYEDTARVPLAYQMPHGSGSVLTLCGDFGRSYRQNRTTVYRNVCRLLAKKQGFVPLATVTGSSFAESVLTQKDGAIVWNLLNTAGDHAVPGTRGYDEIPPIGPLRCEIRLPNAPTAVVSEPEGKALPFRYENGVARFTVERLEIHSAIVIR